MKTRANLERKAEEKARLGSDVAIYVSDPLTNADFEDRYKSEKRYKLAVRRLVNLRTKRMLDILGYTTTEKDARRLDYAIKSFGSENALLQRKLTQLSFGSGGDMGGGDQASASLRGFFGSEGGKALEERITQLGMGIPKLDQDLNRMQHEISVLVERYTEANKKAQGAKDRELQASNTIKNLHKEMDQLRGANQQQSQDGEINNLNRFIEDDYFYKNDSKKPKVSFAPQGDSASKDPIDNFMDQRPARGQAGAAP